MIKILPTILFDVKEAKAKRSSSFVVHKLQTKSVLLRSVKIEVYWTSVKRKKEQFLCVVMNYSYNYVWFSWQNK